MVRDDAPVIAPEFTLPDEVGAPVSLSDLIARGPALLLFYRGDWCSFCARQLGELAARVPDLTELGATVVAISVDEPARSQAFRQRLGLPFPILSDPAHAVIDDYAGVEADLRQGVAVGRPATFIVDRSGRITWSYVGIDHRDRPSIDAIVDQVARAAAAG